MRELLILPAFICTALVANAQDAKDILVNSFKKCQSISNGYFIVHNKIRTFLSKPVYSNYSYKVNFRKITTDTISSCLYNAQYVSKESNSGNIIYTGKSYISYTNPIRTNYTLSNGAGSVNWLFPVDMASYYKSFSPWLTYDDDWFYHGVDIPSGTYAQYLRGSGSNWQNAQSNLSIDEGVIIPTAKFPIDVKQKCTNDLFMFFEPIMSRKSVLLPNYTELPDSNITFKFINTEMLNGNKCWHVQAIKKVMSDTLQTDKAALYTTNYWINIKDSVPVQFTLAKEALPSYGSLMFFRQYTITEYNFNTTKEDWYFSAARVPREITLKKYVGKSKKH